MKHILISDPTLRDGNHAIQHTLTVEQIAAYCRAADAAGIPIVEVGHGNGIGASSLQLGESTTPDELALEFADVLAWLATIANVKGVDLEAAVLKKYGHGCPGCGQMVCACGLEEKP